VISPEVIAITGASSGLGAALAREYAAPGITLALAARRSDRLKLIARECEERGATVVCKQVDVSNPEQTAAWVEDIEQTALIDLMIANAGTFSGHGPNGQMETSVELVRQIEINLVGTTTTINAIASHMKKRHSGHLAMVSSLAAVQPLADAPGYSATKAGIMAYGDALREYLADFNVNVSVILPGHINTAQTAVHIGTKAGVISSQKAAAIIRKRLDRGQTCIAFPQSMYFLVRLGRLLPWRIRAIMNRPFRFHVKKPSNLDDKCD
jgi:short-subunit dehydrogenase